MLEHLLNPQSIAIIGASEDLTKPGGRLTHNVLAKEYKGRLLLVNPKSATIQGIKAYRSIPELPQSPDLTLIAVPATAVRQSLTELAELGAKAVIILSAGFGELGPQGKAEEQALAEIAKQNGMLLLGPNCLGVMSFAHASKFAGLLPDMVQGGIDFLSGSGATIDYLAEQALRRGLQFNSFVTVGNSAQTGITELLTLYDQDFTPQSSKIKIVYVESLTKPQEFLKAARSLHQKGCLLAGIKSGNTQAGRQAAASHTGALATNDVAVQALFDKAGIIRVPSRIELVDVAVALNCARGKLDGRRVCVISDAGGAGVMAADELNRQGFELPPLRNSTRERLAKVLPAGASLANPIDCLPTRTGAMLAEVFKILDEEEADNLDYLVPIAGDSRLVDNWEVYQSILQAMDTCRFPVFPSFCSAISSEAALAKFRQAGKCYFEDEVALAKALGKVVNQPALTQPVLEQENFDLREIEKTLDGQHGLLSPAVAYVLLQAAGLRLPFQIEISDITELAKVDFPFPWAMKVIGPSHKTDVGGVRLNVQNQAEAAQATHDLMQIERARGVLLQPMVKGLEVLLGAKREADFGHLIAFGLGGTIAEVLKDVRFALAPLSGEEARHLISSTQGFPLLQGWRNQPGIDLDLLRDWLLRLSLLVYHFPQIQEMDLNPVTGTGKDLFVVDARVLVD